MPAKRIADMARTDGMSAFDPKRTLATAKTIRSQSGAQSRPQRPMEAENNRSRELNCAALKRRALPANVEVLSCHFEGLQSHDPRSRLHRQGRRCSHAREPFSAMPVCLAVP